MRLPRYLPHAAQVKRQLNYLAKTFVPSKDRADEALPFSVESVTYNHTLYLMASMVASRSLQQARTLKSLLQVDRNVSASVLGAAAMGFKAGRIVLPALRAKVHDTADAAALPEATSEPCRSV